MRIKHVAPPAEGDMTPMIDMTFQLICFFMVLLNFNEAVIDDRIQLPTSELARPPEAAADEALTIQVTREGTIIFTGEVQPVSSLPALLQKEKKHLERKVPPRDPADAIVFIRADSQAKAGVVQEVMSQCALLGFDRIALRALTEAPRP